MTCSFYQPLLTWFDEHGRKNLPWQHPRSAYRVWVSEIMLQQTQVKTVIPYFMRFMTQFPDLPSLASASEDLVLSLWSGLGYYSRARNLHACAKKIMNEHKGQFPDDATILLTLPGIGQSTAAAIASLAFNQQTAILDGNVRRVLSRYFKIDGHLTQTHVKQRLWELAQASMPSTRCADYTQAMMDFGATCCTLKKPLCPTCPLQDHCQAFQTNTVEHYPNKPPKKVKPTQHQQFLFIQNASGHVYLEKRPSIGIWGGLWCLPSIDVHIDPLDYVKQTHRFSITTVKTLMTIKHSFSHYHLHITALALTCEELLQHDNDKITKGQWFRLDDLRSIGIPKPVHQIIQRGFQV